MFNILLDIINLYMFINLDDCVSCYSLTSYFSSGSYSAYRPSRPVPVQILALMQSKLFQVVTSIQPIALIIDLREIRR